MVGSSTHRPMPASQPDPGYACLVLMWSPPLWRAGSGPPWALGWPPPHTDDLQQPYRMLLYRMLLLLQSLALPGTLRTAPHQQPCQPPFQRGTPSTSARAHPDPLPTPTPRARSISLPLAWSHSQVTHRHCSAHICVISQARLGLHMAETTC